MMRFSTKKLILIISAVFIVGVAAGGIGIGLNHKLTQSAAADNLKLDDQEATVRAIKKVIPSVVSIIVYDQVDTVYLDLIAETQVVEKKRKEVGSGTGFIISADGLILTNKHVVNMAEEKTAEYRIILNTGKEYYAQLIGKDPVNDLAVLKIFDKDLPFVELGDSAQTQIGATVIAIGNSLGRYQNSATKGIVSGLARSLTASDFAGNIENFDNVIQTDAEINLGNSGGPLIDLAGRVIGVNVAVDEAGNSVGFAIPVNDARPVIQSVKERGRIARPRLGVRYIMLTPELAKDKGLSRDSGAWLVRGDDGSAAVLPDSPAGEGGLIEGDIIFEINAIKIAGNDTLRSVVQKYKAGDKIGLKIQRGQKIIIRVVELDEFK